MTSPALPEGAWEDESLARHTSLKVGGPADVFSLAHTREEMASLLRWAAEAGLPTRIVGGGSNLLVADAGAAGLTAKAANVGSRVVRTPDGPVLIADAGATLANVARRVSKQGYGGLEWATNVPGTVGGAAVNNAGAFGGDTASCLVAVTVLSPDGAVRRLTPERLGYAYRTSVLKRRELGDVAVVEVELLLKPSTPEASGALVARYTAQRTQSQPRILSAGSVFANPQDSFAGLLIEQAGLKGRRVGGAQISEQHANFIVNRGGARAADVYALVRLAQCAVYERTGIWLHPEIELFGRWSDEERRALAEPGER